MTLREQFGKEYNWVEKKNSQCSCQLNISTGLKLKSNSSKMHHLTAIMRNAPVVVSRGTLRNTILVNAGHLLKSGYSTSHNYIHAEQSAKGER